MELPKSIICCEAEKMSTLEPLHSVEFNENVALVAKAPPDEDIE